jgi:hypothetical protein
VSQYLTNFTGEDMKIAYAKGSEPKKGKSQTSESAETQQMPAETPAEAVSQAELEPNAGAEENVPEGTTAEILAWVGDDKDRAQRALDTENADEKPRKGLTGDLEALLEEDEEE